MKLVTVPLVDLWWGGGGLVSQMETVESSWLLPYFPHPEARLLICWSLILQRRCIPGIHCLCRACWPTLYWVVGLPKLHVSPTSYPETWWSRVVIPCLWDLMPNDLSWSWYNNRNKVHNKCNMLEPSPNLLLTPVCGKNVFHETGPWCQTAWGLLI